MSVKLMYPSTDEEWDKLFNTAYNVATRCLESGFEYEKFAYVTISVSGADQAQEELLRKSCSFFDYDVRAAFSFICTASITTWRELCKTSTTEKLLGHLRGALIMNMYAFDHSWEKKGVNT
jgi:hypothetical protein